MPIEALHPTDRQQRDLRRAARALGRHGLAHAYGHCSLRLSPAHFLVCAPLPMGQIGAGEPGTVVPVHGALPEGVLGEVRIHQQIYARRADVGAVVRSMPPATMALSTARIVPAARHGCGAYFHAGIALWYDPQLLRDDARAAELALALGDGQALVMRGNGLVIAAASIEQAVALTWYFEDAARLELAVRNAGLETRSAVLSDDECRRRATAAGGIFERMWQHLTAGDPEPEPAGESV